MYSAEWLVKFAVKCTYLKKVGKYLRVERVASIWLVWSSGHLTRAENVAWVAVAITASESEALQRVTSSILTAASPKRASPASNGNLSSQVYERQTTSGVTDSNRLFDRDKALTPTITPGERSKDLWPTNLSYAKGPRCCRCLHDSSLLIQWFKEYANRLTC